MTAPETSPAIARVQKRMGDRAKKTKLATLKRELRKAERQFERIPHLEAQILVLQGRLPDAEAFKELERLLAVGKPAWDATAISDLAQDLTDRGPLQSTHVFHALRKAGFDE